jgi:glycosyltransferase involved in cell wall biosynthesis
VRFYKYKRIRKRLNRDRYSKLDGIVFVSKDSKSEFVELFGEQPNMDVVYNLIDKESVLNKSNMNKNRWTSDTFTFCAVGSLMPVKGFDRLIRAAKIVYERGYDFRIVIAGTGNEGKKLKEIVSSLELTNCIIFVGFLENPYPLMKSSDVFVMSSVSEALPTVLCEAMILGLPCLVTNASGCRGLVNSGEFGMMAEQDDTDLANKMILFMEKPGLVEEYSQKALERSKLFDDESVLHNYYKIFDGKYSGN